MTARRAHLYRTRSDSDRTPVTYIELFFDLVFVFAITQLSHRLQSHLSLHGAIETLILFLAIWWVWIYTSWTTNWLDPDRGAVRLLLIGMMLGGLALSSGVPDAFGATGLLFAGAYVAMQFGRSAYMAWVGHGVDRANYRNALRITFYFLLSAPFWISGAFVDGDLRLGAWIVALAIEYAGPFRGFRTPGLGHSVASDWHIAGGHMAERCALFIIIALGEAVLVTGATFAGLTHDRPTTTAFVASFLGSAAMWWIYFDIGAGRASKMIESAGERTGIIARNAYTYLHMPIVAGIVVTAVGDANMLGRPHASVDLAQVLVACGGPLLFLFGNQMFKWVTAEQRLPPLSHFIGILLLLSSAIASVTLRWDALTLGLLVAASLAATATWEWFSLNGGWQRWAPWMRPIFARKA
jgi:low temperature requirement protein LtrA